MNVHYFTEWAPRRRSHRFTGSPVLITQPMRNDTRLLRPAHRRVRGEGNATCGCHAVSANVTCCVNTELVSNEKPITDNLNSVVSISPSVIDNLQGAVMRPRFRNTNICSERERERALTLPRFSSSVLFNDRVSLFQLFIVSSLIEFLIEFTNKYLGHWFHRPWTTN